MALITREMRMAEIAQDEAWEKDVNRKMADVALAPLRNLNAAERLLRKAKRKTYYIKIPDPGEPVDITVETRMMTVPEREQALALNEQLKLVGDDQERMKEVMAEFRSLAREITVDPSMDEYWESDYATDDTSILLVMFTTQYSIQEMGETFKSFRGN